MTDVNNIEAWAVTQGYDPLHKYVQDVPLPAGYVSPHFRAAEFVCHHCGAQHPNGTPKELLAVLEDVRAHFDGKPVTITSGFRCEVHNHNVGGAGNSQHLLGTAADFKVKDVPASTVYAYLDPGHRGGLGKYDTFTHVDVRNERARWSG